MTGAPCIAGWVRRQRKIGIHAVPAAPLLAALAIGVTSAAGQAPAPTPPAPAAAPSAPVNANEQLSCVRPDDAAGIADLARQE